ncbi:hypothetical protein ES703_95988 [subsurface metagenome]
MSIAQTSLATPSYHYLLTKQFQISDNSITTDLCPMEDHSPYWHRYYQVFPFLAMLLFPLTILTIGCSVKSLVLEYTQTANTRISHNHYIATAAAITTIRSAKGDKLLPPEAYHPIATTPCFYHNLC